MATYKIQRKKSIINKNLGEAFSETRYGKAYKNLLNFDKEYKISNKIEKDLLNFKNKFN